MPLEFGCAKAGVGGHSSLLNLTQLPGQLYGITFYHQVKVKIGSSQKQVADYATNEIQVLPVVLGSLTGDPHETNKLGW
jgi:hypothetical protein